jgi:sterol carrier protein 2
MVTLPSPLRRSALIQPSCPTSDGAAAAVIISQAYLDAHPHLKSRAVMIAGQSLATDSPDLYNRSAIELVGADMTRRAAKSALSQAGVTPESIKLVELHDCFSANEMVTIDALGLCPPGKAHEMVRAGDITYGGRVVINPSGGLISKGHPLGATGVAQCAELVWQLRGWAGDRNVEGVEAALQQNLGLGGAAVVTVYKRADGKPSKKVKGEAERIAGRGYNPATEARGLSKGEIESAVSRTKASKVMLDEPKESRL